VVHTPRREDARTTSHAPADRFDRYLYLVGVGVVLSPIVRSEWNSAPASVLAENIARELPDALAWPVRVARGVTGTAPANPSRVSAD
jgi:hypothetical protein